MQTLIKQFIAGKDASVLTDISEQDYRKALGLSQSSLKDFLTSPAHYLSATEEVQEPTKAMQVGTAFHALMLQDNPLAFYAIKKKMDGRTKDGKEYNERFAVENVGKAIIDSEDEETIQRMRESILRHPLARELISKITHKELAIFGTTKDGNVRLKGRLDAYCEEDGFIIDFKSAEDASPEGFKKAIFDRRYDLQNIQYPWLINNAGKKFTKFYFIACEKKPPYAVGVYSISENWLTYTADIWAKAVYRYSDCQKSGVYPAYSDEEVVL